MLYLPFCRVRKKRSVLRWGDRGRPTTDFFVGVVVVGEDGKSRAFRKKMESC